MNFAPSKNFALKWNSLLSFEIIITEDQPTNPNSVHNLKISITFIFQQEERNLNQLRYDTEPTILKYASQSKSISRLFKLMTDLIFGNLCHSSIHQKQCSFLYPQQGQQRKG
ncbi:unnamed protein product [Paramecium octaurelia]|uniref:Uncharacterized protein n=1 Tax=Paramecium octaurelia TaxID=43137 RepID=A0A8S1U255_PAROT|nr:unnamed protein product [Paramecium octaurelia]